MDECNFCKIANKKALTTILYEDDLVMAIAPMNPVSKGHTLLIPKNHFENIFDVSVDVAKVLGIKMKELSVQLVRDNDAAGINILNANGKDAQQSVMHLHFHLVPRYTNDGLDLWLNQNL